MKFSVLSSGSKQNCFYIESGHSAILVDIGLTRRKLSHYLEMIGRDISRVNAVFISHEHLDHVMGLPSFTRYYPQIPVYVHKQSRKGLLHNNKLVHFPAHIELSADNQINIGELEIFPFNTNHDSANNFGFRISSGKRSLFLASDIGSYDSSIVSFASDANLIAIESNNDEEMIEISKYPEDLRKRIKSDTGHLSNNDAMKFLKKAISPATEKVFLLHISDNTNSTEYLNKALNRHKMAQLYPDIEFARTYKTKPSPLVEV